MASLPTTAWRSSGKVEVVLLVEKDGKALRHFERCGLAQTLVKPVKSMISRRPRV
jgi:hypothetical protein